jgi:adenylate cyclase
LVLFVFAATHFLNHALGLVSLDDMMEFDAWRTAIIRSLAGSTVLAGVLVTHVGLALRKIQRRRTLRLPTGELTQIVCGLAIPLFLMPHFVSTRIANSAFLMLVVWVHGCIGLYY